MNTMMATLALTSAALALPVLAQETRPESSEAGAELTYDDAMRCAALYTITLDIIGPDNPTFVPVLKERATRWITMAMLRDGENGARADRELESVATALAGEFERLGDSQPDQDDFANRQFYRCDRFEEAYADEFNAIMVMGK